MSNSVPVPAATQPSEPCIVVFGRDEAGKPHASWFDAEHAELAVKAAELMNMRDLRVETEEQEALIAPLRPSQTGVTAPLPASVNNDPTLLHGDDPVGQIHDLGVVRHHQGRRAALLAEALQ